MRSWGFVIGFVLMHLTVGEHGSGWHQKATVRFWAAAASALAPHHGCAPPGVCARDGVAALLETIEGMTRAILLVDCIPPRSLPTVARLRRQLIRFGAFILQSQRSIRN